jgi:ACS family hexuronate transporter-like MFS transporter
MMISKFIGYVLDASGSYASIFAVAGGAYFAALIALHLLSPRLTPTRAGLDTPLPETVR